MVLLFWKSLLSIVKFHGGTTHKQIQILLSLHPNVLESLSSLLINFIGYLIIASLIDQTIEQNLNFIIVMLYYSMSDQSCFLCVVGSIGGYGTYQDVITLASRI